MLVTGNEPQRIGLRSFVDLCHGCCPHEGPLTICSTVRLVAMHVRLNTSVLLQPLGSSRDNYPLPYARVAHIRGFSGHVMQDDHLAGISPDLLRPALTCRSSRSELQHQRHGFIPRRTSTLFLSTQLSDLFSCTTKSILNTVLLLAFSYTPPPTMAFVQKGIKNILQKNPNDVVILSALRTPVTRAKKGGLRDAYDHEMLGAVRHPYYHRLELKSDNVGPQSNNPEIPRPRPLQDR